MAVLYRVREGASLFERAARVDVGPIVVQLEPVAPEPVVMLGAVATADAGVLRLFVSAVFGFGQSQKP
jgi:hypothetical protein